MPRTKSPMTRVYACQAGVERDKAGNIEIGDTGTRYRKCQVEEGFLCQLMPVSNVIY